jgi:NADH-quinone oxidoreductase subunit L
VFPFAGFWSKDEILLDSLKHGVNEGYLSGYLAFVLLLVAAIFTAFYMWRQVSLVFYGKPRHAAAEHASEPSNLMTRPLMVLAMLSLLIGLINIPSGFPILGWLLGKHQFTSFLEHSVTFAHAGSFNLLMAIMAVVFALGAIFAARALYNDTVLEGLERDPLELDQRTAGAFALANAKLYWDEFYFAYIIWPYRRAAYWLAERLDWEIWHNFVHERLIRDPFNRATQILAEPVDKGFIDKNFNRLGTLARSVSSRMRVIQTGYVRTYALSVLFGALLVVVLILLPVLRELLGL